MSGGWKKRRGAETSPTRFTAGQLLYSAREDVDDEGRWVLRVTTCRLEKETTHYLHVVRLNRKGEAYSGTCKVLKDSTEAKQLHESPAAACLARITSYEREAARLADAAKRSEETASLLKVYAQKEGLI